MSVWLQKLSEIRPIENSLTWYYKPRAPTTYICPEHRMSTPIPSDHTSQKPTTIQILNWHDVAFHLMTIRQTTVEKCFTNEPQRSGWAKAHILCGFDPQTVDYMQRQIKNHLFSVANTPIGAMFCSQYAPAACAYRETMENVRILFARPLQLKQCVVFRFFSVT